ncbi:hypothetical protein [Arthrobacter sp. 35/47]|uniref:hypothetical protein n=1 Tax=Arthrobacter sp. 35/47 TaxID=269454 RepID=UPI00138AEF63|nr:hypothetical protein [Arthrobacter sp. 35/47]
MAVEESPLEVPLVRAKLRKGAQSLPRTLAPCGQQYRSACSPERHEGGERTIYHRSARQNHEASRCTATRGREEHISVTDAQSQPDDVGQSVR